jgi:pimeloyl-ACP methyl ester carboxylesterase
VTAVWPHTCRVVAYPAEVRIRPQIRVLAWLITAVAVLESSALAQSAPTMEVVGQLRPSVWSEYRISADGRAVTAYVAADHVHKPVIVLFQGSGCTPLFTIAADGSHYGTAIFEDLIAPRQSRFHFVMVEKRGVTPLRFTSGMTEEDQRRAFSQVEANCSDTYRKNATKTARVDDAASVVAALRRQPWAGPVLVAGHSEGSQVVTGLVRRTESSLAAAALMSSAGPTQFFAMYVAQGAPERARFRETFDTIRWLQKAEEDADYKGHPARRWKTFALDSTPLDDVRDSQLPLFVAHGEREANILAADLFVLEALRHRPNRPLRYVVVADADHGFSTADGDPRLADVFDDFLRWALGERTTAVEVLR